MIASDSSRLVYLEDALLRTVNNMSLIIGELKRIESKVNLMELKARSLDRRKRSKKKAKR